MNLNSIVNMVMRQLLNRGMRTAFSKSDELIARARRPRDELEDRERALQEREAALARRDREEELARREAEIARREAELRDR